MTCRGVGEEPSGREVVLQVDLRQVVHRPRQPRKRVRSGERRPRDGLVFHAWALVGVQGLGVGVREGSPDRPVLPAVLDDDVAVGRPAALQAAVGQDDGPGSPGEAAPARPRAQSRRRGGWFNKCQRLAVAVLRGDWDEANSLAEDFYDGPPLFDEPE